jgi:hypothetical protein
MRVVTRQGRLALAGPIFGRKIADYLTQSACPTQLTIAIEYPDEGGVSLLYRN